MPRFKIHKPNKMLVGGDFSQLEVKTSVYCSQDPDMLKAYEDGKDLYSVIASMAYGKPYEQCLEYYPEGTEIEIDGEKIVCGHKTHTNKEGKATRQSSKSLLIGSIYQRGAASIGEQLNKPKEEAQALLDKFYKGFPTITQWMADSKEFTLKNGYMDNAVGRRRRLPNALLPKYSFTNNNDSNLMFNPIIGCEGLLDDNIINKYKKLLENVKSQRDYEDIQKAALAEGIEIHNNNALIAQCLRQCVNFQAQSLGADIIKQVMVSIDHDTILNDLGFDLLLTVHDEVIGQCPEENVDAVSDRLIKIMTTLPYNLRGLTIPWNVPMNVDTYIVKSWYEDEVTTAIIDYFGKYVKTMDSESAFNKICEEHPELTPESIHKVIFNNEQLKV